MNFFGELKSFLVGDDDSLEPKKKKKGSKEKGLRANERDSGRESERSSERGSYRVTESESSRESGSASSRASGGASSRASGADSSRSSGSGANSLRGSGINPSNSGNAMDWDLSSPVLLKKHRKRSESEGDRALGRRGHSLDLDMPDGDSESRRGIPIGAHNSYDGEEYVHRSVSAASSPSSSRTTKFGSWKGPRRAMGKNPFSPVKSSSAGSKELMVGRLSGDATGADASPGNEKSPGKSSPSSPRGGKGKEKEKEKESGLRKLFKKGSSSENTSPKKRRKGEEREERRELGHDKVETPQRKLNSQELEAFEQHLRHVSVTRNTVALGLLMQLALGMPLRDTKDWVPTAMWGLVLERDLFRTLMAEISAGASGESIAEMLLELQKLCEQDGARSIDFFERTLEVWIHDLKLPVSYFRSLLSTGMCFRQAYAVVAPVVGDEKAYEAVLEGIFARLRRFASTNAIASACHGLTLYEEHLEHVPNTLKMLKAVFTKIEGYQYCTATIASDLERVLLSMHFYIKKKSKNKALQKELYTKVMRQLLRINRCLHRLPSKETHCFCAFFLEKPMSNYVNKLGQAPLPCNGKARPERHRALSMSTDSMMSLDIPEEFSRSERVGESAEDPLGAYHASKQAMHLSHLRYDGQPDASSLSASPS